MYTMIPFRSRRDLSAPMNDLFNDRFFRSFFDMGDVVGAAGFRVDMREQPDAYLLEAELPGVKQDAGSAWRASARRILPPGIRTAC